MKYALLLLVVVIELLMWQYQFKFNKSVQHFMSINVHTDFGAK